MYGGETIHNLNIKKIFPSKQNGRNYHSNTKMKKECLKLILNI